MLAQLVVSAKQHYRRLKDVMGRVTVESGACPGKLFTPEAVLVLPPPRVMETPPFCSGSAKAMPLRPATKARAATGRSVARIGVFLLVRGAGPPWARPVIDEADRRVSSTSQL